MSETPRLPTGKRKQVIKENYAFKRIEDIATLCGVDDRTIYRDIKKMKKSGEWEQYIESTIQKLSSVGDVDDGTKFREFMKIYGKMFTEKHEIENKGDISIIIKKWSIDDGDTPNP